MCNVAVFCNRPLCQILGLSVECARRDYGCNYRGTLRIVTEDHEPKKCQFRTVVCGDCKTMVVFSHLPEHHELDRCPLCSTQYFHCLTSKHRCKACLNGCGIMLEMSPSSRADHDKICPNMVVTCKYADIGCMVTLSRKLMLEHEADLLEHFSCMHVRIYCYSRRLALKNRNVVIIFFQKYVAFANMRIALLEVFYASCYVNCCI